MLYGLLHNVVYFQSATFTFATLQDMYNISYTLLGSLVLTNFCTQLLVDLIFTAFSKHFNIKKVVRVMPLLTSSGLVIYAVLPNVMPQYAYLGLITGTVLFSVSAGLSEVLLSPVIAAIPSDNPQKDMSKLHSLYAFGVFTVVVVSTAFLKIFSAENWMYLTLFWAAMPIIASVLFFLSPMPDMSGSAESANTKGTKRRAVGMALCVACIFFGSCAENAMSNWISSYMENALHIDKALGDILGMAVFAILLGLTRITYAKYGKNIFKMLLCGMIGATVCYIVAGLSLNVIFAFIACILSGIFVAMLWPGTLIMMEENLPGLGVAAYALMAAGGDMGASLAPQLLGIVVDKVSVTQTAADLSVKIGLTTEQIGLKAGMLVTALFPIIGIITVVLAIRYFKSNKSIK